MQLEKLGKYRSVFLLSSFNRRSNAAQRRCMGRCGNGRANEGVPIGATDLPDLSKLSAVNERYLKN
jgi:hypothetical protein